MAYRSSGADNNGMVSNLKRYEVISSLSVEEGFRKVDRKFFVPKGAIGMAHTDQPIREGNIHISAPHIYGAIMEALELPRNSAMTFLNAGSGTGYLTCIAASILGPKSSHYCIEIHEDAIEHCKQAISDWRQDCPSARDIELINIIHGNALELKPDEGECALGFDRVYIGAAIEPRQLDLFKRLLKPGGILVGPVDSELIKVIRAQTPGHVAEFRQEYLSPVRFASLISHPKLETKIEAEIWRPNVHRHYPNEFQESCKALLMSACTAYHQPLPNMPPPAPKVNVACMLPRALWLEILSYTHRDWFRTPLSEADLLRQQLREEREKAELANRARLEADAKCHLMEKERDIYRLLARRVQRIPEERHTSRQEAEDDMETEAIEDAAAALILGGGSLHGLGLRNIFRRFRNQAMVEDESEEDDGDSSSSSDRMDEDDEDDDEVTEESSSSQSTSVRDPLDTQEESHQNSSEAWKERRRVRAVSIAKGDI